jgi:hypothetical protein
MCLDLITKDQDAAGVPVYGLSAFSQSHAAWRLFKNARTDEPLQSPHLRADGRLRKAQHLGCPSKAALVSDCDDGSQAFDGYVLIPSAGGHG